MYLETRFISILFKYICMDKEGDACNTKDLMMQLEKIFYRQFGQCQKIVNNAKICTKYLNEKAMIDFTAIALKEYFRELEMIKSRQTSLV